MANIRPLVAIALLVTLGSEASIAMPPQEIPAEVKSCKAIVDDKERLKCFDGLFGETSKPQNLEKKSKPTGQSRKPNRQLTAVLRWLQPIS